MKAFATSARHVHDLSVWTSRDFGPTRSWVRQLSSEAIAELLHYTSAALAKGLTFENVGVHDFPLKHGASLLKDVRDSLENGRGFAVIGGFPVERLAYQEALIAYAGLCANLGVLVDQSYAGAMKADVKDLGLAYGKDVRGYQSNSMLRFHTDGAAYTGLLCLSEALEGGLSVLTSSGALSNRILKERPDIHALLVAGFYHHRRGEHAPGDNPVSAVPIPVFGFYDELLHCTYDRNQSLWAIEEGITFSAEQIEAMDYLDALMASPEYQLHMEMRQGDIQFVNNFTVMHARTEYRNAPGKERHLVRYWIDAPEGKRRGLTTRDLYVRNSLLVE